MQGTEVDTGATVIQDFVEGYTYRAATATNQRPSDPITTPLGTQSGNVSITYSLQDKESDVCSIRAEYSANGGGTWYTATAGSETTALTASPSGTAHTFVWKSGSDIVNANNTNVKFRITPADAGGEGTAGTTSAFTVNNSVALLTPTISSDASGRTFGFIITGPSNTIIVVEVCPNLTSPVWSPLQTVTLTNGSFYFSEPMQVNSSGRYYRARSQ
jgi:hypothetical protein